jgi:hypothetical protein
LEKPRNARTAANSRLVRRSHSKKERRIECLPGRLGESLEVNRGAIVAIIPLSTISRQLAARRRARA